MKRFLLSLLGLSLLPLLWALILTLIALVKGVSGGSGWFSPETLSLLAGHLLWILVWLFMPHPVRAYVVGHELTHALWGLLFGARVSNVKVGRSGGSVTLDKSNFLITLAPYFFPFYTVILLLAGALVRLCVGFLPSPPVWFFLVGVTWSFHLTFTVSSLMERQPDIQEYGVLFSYGIILVFNLFLVDLWIVLTSSLKLSIFLETLIGYTGRTCLTLFNWARSAVVTLAGWVGLLPRTP